MESALSLYDTMTRSQLPLVAEDGERFRFYCCGPTVYGPAHIGNFRAFLVQDVLRRTLEVAGMHPYHVRNLTDVDDKTIRTSLSEGKSLREFTNFWTEKFQADAEALNLLAPHKEPRATDHIPQQIDLIKRLIEKGLAYPSSDGSVYFKVSAYEPYGKLSRLKEREITTQSTTSAGEHNDADEYDRESVADFALWKSRKPEDGDNFWESPWGEGRPGWHLECSAMSLQYLGESFDLHGGGIDLCFPHHENEIAQSEGATGKTFARHWFHNAHLMVEGQKMSKSLGNLYTLDELQEKGYTPMEVRYCLISGHYRQPLNFTFASLKSGRSAMNKMEKALTPYLEKLGMSEEDFQNLAQPPFAGEWGHFQRAWDGLRNDLNVSQATGGIFAAFAQLEKQDLNISSLQKEITALAYVLYALGIQLFLKKEEPEVEIPEAIDSLAAERWQAKQDRDWEKADVLRQQLSDAGWLVLDRKDGYDLKPGK
ncbi:MAG: cysteine--tRNA ligase [Verrucomicrobiae bacterium]|nr:cysteine--tRNA ligase [Verrucomicrobiae bacterium]